VIIAAIASSVRGKRLQFHVLSFEGPDGYSRAGGVAFTGCSGEDYVVPGQNALVLESGDPHEFVGLFKRLRANPDEALLLRRAARNTARRYRWSEVVPRALQPRIDLLYPTTR
jgi:hypothetical protein